VRKHENTLVLGQTGVDEDFIAPPLAQKACISCFGRIVATRTRSRQHCAWISEPRGPLIRRRSLQLVSAFCGDLDARNAYGA